MSDTTLPENSTTTTDTTADVDATAADTAVVAEATAATDATDALDTKSLINADATDTADTTDAEEGETDATATADATGAPDAYELTAPEGFELDQEAVALAEPVFRELGLTNDAANKLMPVAAQFAERIAAKTQAETQQALIDTVVQTRADWAKTALADPEIGGTPEHHAEVRAVVAKAIDDFSPRDAEGVSPFRTFLDETGLGNHPEMIRLLHRVGQSISEESRVFRADSGGTAAKRADQVMYDPAFQPKG